METPNSHAPARARRTPRNDGVESRDHLLRTALRLFAEKGFADTSVREIARAASSNVAAISYYFGDKAGLYRAAFHEPMCTTDVDPHALYGNDLLTLREALEGIISCLTAPLKQGELAYLSLRLRHREMLEPTGILTEDTDMFKATLEVLTSILQRHLGLDAADDDLRRLTFSIFAVSVQQLSYRDLLKQIYPEMLDAPTDYRSQLLRSVDYAQALIEGEYKRRSRADHEEYRAACEEFDRLWNESPAPSHDRMSELLTVIEKFEPGTRRA